ERIAARQARRVAILGLAFKPNVDDLRGSPALQITCRVAADNPGVSVDVVEPFIDELPASLSELANVRLVSAREALSNAELVVGLVRHDDVIDVLRQLPALPREFLDFVDFSSLAR